MHGIVCKCPESKKPIAQRAWVITQYKCHYSAFNGYRRTNSDFSQIFCPVCGMTWRTKAAYVNDLKLEK